MTFNLNYITGKELNHLNSKLNQVSAKWYTVKNKLYIIGKSQDEQFDKDPFNKIRLLVKILNDADEFIYDSLKNKIAPQINAIDIQSFESKLYTARTLDKLDIPENLTRDLEDIDFEIMTVFEDVIKYMYELVNSSYANNDYNRTWWQKLTGQHNTNKQTLQKISTTRNILFEKILEFLNLLESYYDLILKGSVQKNDALSSWLQTAKKQYPLFLVNNLTKKQINYDDVPKAKVILTQIEKLISINKPNKKDQDTINLLKKNAEYVIENSN